MVAPTVHPITARIYGSLPEFYRDADVDDGTTDGQPLLRFLSLILDQQGTTEDLIDRIDPDLGNELLDADAADAAWLPWLGQLVGVRFAEGLTVTEQRLAVGAAVSGWRAGTRETIAKAARSALLDPDGYVTIRSHAGGDPFVVSITVDPAVAPADLNDVLDAIEASRARPAGVRIAVDLYTAAWSTIEAVYPTWADLEAAVTWARIEGTLPP